MAHNNCKIELKCHSLQYIKIIIISIVIIIIILSSYIIICAVFTEKLTRLLVVS